MLDVAKALKPVLRTLLGVTTLQPACRGPSGCAGHVRLQYPRPEVTVRNVR